MLARSHLDGCGAQLRWAHAALRRFVPFALSGTIAALGSGCVKHYEPPSASEPHALVKLRRVFHSAAGPQRATNADFNQQRVYSRDESAEFDAPQTDALRVHPGPGSWEFAVEFHHLVTHRVQETYYEQVPYTATETYTEYQSYSCGFGTTQRTCQRPSTRTRTVTRYRSQAKQRWVNRTQRVVDDSCEAHLQGVYADGEVYLLQFTYTGAGVCSVQCLKQLPDAAAGSPSTVPCGQ